MTEMGKELKSVLFHFYMVAFSVLINEVANTI